MKFDLIKTSIISNIGIELAIKLFTQYPFPERKYKSINYIVDKNLHAEIAQIIHLECNIVNKLSFNGCRLRSNSLVDLNFEDISKPYAMGGYITIYDAVSHSSFFNYQLDYLADMIVRLYRSPVVFIFSNDIIDQAYEKLFRTYKCFEYHKVEEVSVIFFNLNSKKMLTKL